ncbi:D-galactonate transporter [Sodalis praecaptivus]
MTGLDRSVATLAGAKSIQLRRFIVLMLFITVVINYVDRSSLSIAAPHIVEELGLSSVQMGFVFSAFAWAYSPFQIRDRFWWIKSRRGCYIPL